MSQLLVVTRPGLVPGYQLAGVEAYGARDAAEAKALIQKWLDAGEKGLLAIEETLVDDFDRIFLRRLESAEEMPFIALPGEKTEGMEFSGRSRIAMMLRRAVGFHITFQGE